MVHYRQTSGFPCILSAKWIVVGHTGLLWSFRFTAARKTATNLTVSVATGCGEIVCVEYELVDDIRPDDIRPKCR